MDVTLRSDPMLHVEGRRHFAQSRRPLVVVIVLGIALTHCSEVKEDPALLKAAETGRVEEIRRLIASGADVNTRDRRFFETPLMKAAGCGRAEAARTLIHAGARVDARDRAGRTSLIHAARAGDTELIQLLLQAGADVNARDDSGDTALMEAAFYGRIDALASLRSAGADVNAIGGYGETALSQAVTYGHADVASWLRRAGAKERRQLLERLLFTSLTRWLGSTIGGLIVVALGLRILSGRPLVLSTLLYGAWVPLIGFSGLISQLYSLPSKLLEGRADWTREWYWLLFLIAMVVVLPLLQRHSPVSIFNAAEEGVRDAIRTLLRSEGIAYEEKGSRILLHSPPGATTVITVKAARGGTVSLEFWSLVRKDARAIARKIAPGLRRTLGSDPRHRQRFFGALHVSIGLLVLALPFMLQVLIR